MNEYGRQKGQFSRSHQGGGNGVSSDMLYKNDASLVTKASL